jgi:hypothetical protein
MNDSIESPNAASNLALPRAWEKPRLLERAWLQRTVFCFSSLLPAGLLVYLFQVDISSLKQDYALPTSFTLALVVASMVMVYAIVESFDPGSLWPFPFRTLAGYLLKMMACLHAVTAIYLVCEKQAQSAMLSDVPEALIWAAFGYCWLIVPLAFLVGDVQLRRREHLA